MRDERWTRRRTTYVPGKRFSPQGASTRSPTWGVQLMSPPLRKCSWGKASCCCVEGVGARVAATAVAVVGAGAGGGAAAAAAAAAACCWVWMSSLVSLMAAWRSATSCWYWALSGSRATRPWIC